MLKSRCARAMFFTQTYLCAPVRTYMAQNTFLDQTIDKESTCFVSRQPKYEAVRRICVNFIYVPWSSVSSGILHILHYYQIFAMIHINSLM